MRPISAWAHMMSTSVTVAPETGQDGYGKPTYGAAVRYKAHIGQGRSFVRTSTGQEIESGQTVHLNTIAPILPTAQVTLTTADAGSTEEALIHPSIIKVERLSDQRGPHHVVLYL